MATKPRIERPNSTIKNNIVPLTDSVKIKIANAVNSVVSTIKQKHLG